MATFRVEVVQSFDAQRHNEFFGACTLKGNRPYQEDAFVLDGTRAILADGMGGHPDGDVVSRLACEVGHSLSPEAALLAADDAVQKYNNEKHRGAWRAPGTTMIAVERDANNLFDVAHLGDSRVYLFTEDHYVQITTDHEQWGGGLTKWVGGLGHRPEVRTVELAPGERLVICSDGLFLDLEDDELAETIRSLPDATDVELAEALALEAVKAGGGDNVTVIVASHKELG
jgi:PPM family protein phosphatase